MENIKSFFVLVLISFHQSHSYPLFYPFYSDNHLNKLQSARPMLLHLNAFLTELFFRKKYWIYILMQKFNLRCRPTYPKELCFEHILFYTSLGASTQITASLIGKFFDKRIFSRYSHVKARSPMFPFSTPSIIIWSNLNLHYQGLLPQKLRLF